ncbi:OLC1v1025082C1 [Oldenlandia corymbosa var. corymbosa]|uniref:OLC1v1025082C1 n=1 Tax=Oldenlandia corymbosa var. corymbosa TaxID=529605 RepID=A0AAV1C474_OLDCO|nr:OLC1v1025082C1 [Oldenlandia corymbosa var. corymbosa]
MKFFSQFGSCCGGGGGRTPGPTATAATTTATASAPKPLPVATPQTKDDVGRRFQVEKKATIPSGDGLRRLKPTKSKDWKPSIQGIPEDNDMMIINESSLPKHKAEFGNDSNLRGVLRAHSPFI